MSSEIQVLVVDDTITYRSILSRIVENLPNAKLAGTASNGKIALGKMATAPIDMVLLDIEMPEMDGLETLKEIRKRYPNTGVVMVSGLSRSSADITIRALESGAMDFIPKPDGDNRSQSEEELRSKLSAVFRHFAIKRNLRRPAPPVSTTSATSSTARPAAAPLPPPPPPPPVISAAPKPSRFDVVAIGVSTGGPNALAEVIPNLPGDLNVPVVIVQHMPPVFTASLAASLSKKSKMPVTEAADQETLQPNHVYIAPGGRHMTIVKDNAGYKVVLNDDAPENSCRPAVDVLFRSVASAFGKNILSVIMTGMGSDGALGVKALKQVGCYSLSQSERTCVVFGMPKAVEEMHLSDEVIDLNQLAGKITQLVRKGR